MKPVGIDYVIVGGKIAADHGVIKTTAAADISGIRTADVGIKAEQIPKALAAV